MPEPESDLKNTLSTINTKLAISEKIKTADKEKQLAFAQEFKLTKILSLPEDITEFFTAKIESENKSFEVDSNEKAKAIQIAKAQLGSHHSAPVKLWKLATDTQSASETDRDSVMGARRDKFADTLEKAGYRLADIPRMPGTAYLSAKQALAKMPGPSRHRHWVNQKVAQVAGNFSTADSSNSQTTDANTATSAK